MHHDLQFHGRSTAIIEICMRALAMHMSGKAVFTAFCNAYHPFLWWTTIVVERCKVLSDVSYPVVSLPPSSAGVERSFKIRSGVHGKHCVQLQDEKDDHQLHIVYNSHQLRRIRDGELATSRQSVICELLTDGYSSFTRAGGSQLSEALSAAFTAEGKAEAHEMTNVDNDLDDDDELFGSNANFVDHIDDVLG